MVAITFNPAKCALVAYGQMAPGMLLQHCKQMNDMLTVQPCWRRSAELKTGEAVPPSGRPVVLQLWIQWKREGVQSIGSTWDPVHGLHTKNNNNNNK